MSTPLASMASSRLWWTFGITACSSWLSSLYTPCKSLPLMLADFILPAFTSFINCVYESWASGRDLVLWTTVQNRTTITMMTTQNMAVLKLELFMPSPYTWGYTDLITWTLQLLGSIRKLVFCFRHLEYGAGLRPGGELRGRPEPPGPYNLLIISDNRPVAPFPQGYPGFLKEKLDLFRFGVAHSSILVTWSPVTQLKAGRASAPAETLPVQFIHHCNTRRRDRFFL